MSDSELKLQHDEHADGLETLTMRNSSCQKSISVPISQGLETSSSWAARARAARQSLFVLDLGDEHSEQSGVGARLMGVAMHGVSVPSETSVSPS